MKFEIKRNQNVVKILGVIFIIAGVIAMVITLLFCMNDTDMIIMGLSCGFQPVMFGGIFLLVAAAIPKIYFMVDDAYLTILQGNSVIHKLMWRDIKKIVCVDGRYVHHVKPIRKDILKPWEIIIEMNDGKEYRYIGNKRTNRAALDAVSQHHDIVNYP